MIYLQNRRIISCIIFFAVIPFLPLDVFAQIQPAGIDSTQLPFQKTINYKRQSVDARRNLQQYQSSMDLPQDLPLQPDIHDMNVFKTITQHTASLLIQDDYVLGAGDQIGIFLVGRTIKAWHPIIAADGKINLPMIGVFKLAGMTVKTAGVYLKDTLDRHYTNVKLELSVLKLRMPEVFIGGEIFNPGMYSLNSPQGLIRTLINEARLTPFADLRAIIVESPDGTRAGIDFYPLMLGANAGPHVAIQSGSRIYIQPQKRWCAINGFIPRPGLFQLVADGTENIADFLKWAGGLFSNTDSGYVQLSRLTGDGGRALSILNLKEAQDLKKIVLNGDILTFFRNRKMPGQKISVLGEVIRPGRFLYAEGMRLTDALRLAGGPGPNADLKRVEYVHVLPLGKDATTLVDLSAFNTGREVIPDPLLSPFDKIFIRQKPEWSLNKTVTVSGDVPRPGTYLVEEDSTRLHDLLRQLQMSSNRPLPLFIRIIRKEKLLDKGATTMLTEFPMQQKLTQSDYDDVQMRRDIAHVQEIVVQGSATGDLLPVENPFLMHGDVIHFPKVSEFVYVAGRVGRPGAIPFKLGEDTDYYVSRAGNVLWNGDRGEIKLVKASGHIKEFKAIKQIERGDIIWVPPKPDGSLWAGIRNTVSVLAQIATIFFIIDQRKGR